MPRKLCLLLCLILAVIAARPAGAAVQGVMTHEIIVGTHLDLSGPLALWGTHARNGMRMAIDEANAAGGVNGRKLRLVVADNKYDAATAKAEVLNLLTNERSFAILSPLGTPAVQASLPLTLERRVLHLFPLSPDAQNYAPLHPLKFATIPSYGDGIAQGLEQLLALNRARKVGVLYQDNAFGREIRDGAETALGHRGLKLVSAVSHPSSKSNVSKEIAKLKSDRVDVVVLGTIVQDTLAVLRAARARNWRPLFLCSAACYTPETATLGGSLAEGLYAVGHVPIPYLDDPNAKLRAWAARYQKKFRKTPLLPALQAYLNARLFIDALIETGPAPSQKGLAHTLETMGPWVDPELGGIPVDFGRHNHLGMRAGFLARVHNGRWVIVPETLETASRAQSASAKSK